MKGVLSILYGVQDLLHLRKCDFADLPSVDPTNLPTMAFTQSCKEYVSAGINPVIAACNCNGKCATKSCLEPTHSYKVPLKACQNAIIEHSLVRVTLAVEWPDKLGDEPQLVIDITNKKPITTFFQQNQSSPSVVVNSVHHHQQQEAFDSTYQQQYYHHHHSSTINNHDPLSSITTITDADQNDVSSTTTTTTIVYNSIPPQLQTSTSPVINQQFINETKNQLSPIFRRQPPSNPQFFSSQNVIQTPPSAMNDCRPNVPIPTMNSMSSSKKIPSITTHYVDLQQAPTMTCPPSTLPNSTLRSLICSCSNPPDKHEHNCPVVNFTKQQQQQQQQLNATPLNKSIYRIASDRPTVQRPIFPPQTHINNTIPIPSTKDPMIISNSVPFPNPNLMNTSNLPPNITTIISQQPQFPINNQLGTAIKVTPLDNDNNFQPQSFNFSQIPINNPSNYQMKSSIQTPIVEQQNITPTNSHQTKKRPIKQNNLANQDQIPLQNLNDSQQQQTDSMNKFNSVSKQQNNSPSTVLLSPIILQHGTNMSQDNSQITKRLSFEKDLNSPINDMKKTTTQEQYSPRSNSMIRSPVELDIPVTQNMIQTYIGTKEIDETITDVAVGKVDISVDNRSTSISSQQRKQSISTSFVCEPQDSIKPYQSPIHQKQLQLPYNSDNLTLTHQNVINVTQPVIHPTMTGSNKINTVTQQIPTNNTKKRNRAKATNNTEPKHMRKSTINIKQSMATSSSHQDTLQIRTITMTSPITPITNSINNTMVRSDTHISSSPSGCVTTTTDLSIENLKHSFTSDLWQEPNVDNTDMISTYIGSQNDHGQLNDQISQCNYDLDIFSTENDDHFNPLTPPLPSSVPIPLSIPSQIMTPASIERPSNTPTIPMTNSNDVYENFFQPNMPPPLSAWQENQVTSSVLTPPDLQNNQSTQRKYYSQPSDYFESTLQSQTPILQMAEKSSNKIAQMNGKNDIQPLNKQQQSQPKQKPSKKIPHQLNSTNNKTSKQPSKSSQQQNRSHTNKKQTSKKFTCTRCGLTRLHDITHHEFPTQKGLVFECVNCGNNSLRSNVSPEERQRRLAKIATDHLNTVVCQFCHTLFHSHNDYLMHLRNDHASNKPM